MRKISGLIFLLFLLSLQGCFLYGNKPMLSLSTIVKQKENLNSTLSSVNISNNQITINGSGFIKATSLQIKGNGIDTKFNITSQSDSQIIATATNSIALLVGGTFELIIGSVNAASTYSVTFNLQNGAVQATHLASMGASTGQILKFDGNNWGPSNLSSSQLYRGTYDANSNIPDLATITPVAGDYYIVTVEGTYNGVLYPINSWIMFNGTDWEKIANNAPVVSSFKGRRGLVVPLKGDYNLGLMSDVTLGTLTSADTGKVLTYDDTSKSWIPTAPSGGGGGGAGTVTSVSGTAPISVATGTSTPVISISQASTSTNGFLISADWNIFNSKQANIIPTTSSDYYGGDKVFHTLDTAVVVENAANLYYTTARTLLTQVGTISNVNSAIVSGDSIQDAFNKTQGQIANLGTSAGTTYLVKTTATSDTLASNITLSGTIAATNASSITVTNAPVGMTEVTNKSYVDNSWISSGTTKTYNNTATAIGIGTASPQTKLDVNGTIRVGVDASTACSGVIAGAMKFNSPNIEYCDGTTWKAFGVSGTGLTSLNNLTASVQTFAIGTAGTAPLFNSATSTHTLNIPMASTSSVTAGLISKADYDNFNSKQSNLLAIGNILVGSTSGVASAVTVSGDATLSNAGVLNLKNTGTAGTYYSVTTDAQGRVVSGANIAATSSTDGYLTSTDWNTFNGKQASLISGGTINGIVYPTSGSQTLQVPLAPVSATDVVNKQYVDNNGTWTIASGNAYRLTGNVGIGTTNPISTLDVNGTISLVGAPAAKRVGGTLQFGDVGNASKDLALYTYNSERLRIDSAGNVGIGTITPTDTLTVKGTIRGQAAFDNSNSNVIDWSKGNTQYTSSGCSGTPFTFSNMRDGGVYTLVVTGSFSANCTFSQSTPDTLSGTPGSGNFYFLPANSTPTGSNVIYSYLRAGSNVYVTWNSGFTN
jgi:hypothetical protein